jgi:hypothetical protein
LKAKNRRRSLNKNKKPNGIMKQTTTQDNRAKTLARPALAHEAAPVPARRGWVFGGGFLARTEVLALLLSFLPGASLLNAGEQPCQPRYRFIEITLPGPSQAVGINDNAPPIWIWPAPEMAFCGNASKPSSRLTLKRVISC